jgi:hypothetical protein
MSTKRMILLSHKSKKQTKHPLKQNFGHVFFSLKVNLIHFLKINIIKYEQ